MQHVETQLADNAGLDLFVQRYTPDGGDARRTLVVVHGVCEHGQRYEHVARAAVDRGWNVLIADLRGHGRSAGVRTHVAHFRDYLEDLERIRTYFGLQPETTALLGHSMGGLIAIRYVQTHPGRVAALALTSPLLGIKVPVNPCTVALGRMLLYVAPRTRFGNRIDPADVVRDPAALEQRRLDPLIVRSITASWYFAMRRALAAAWNEADRVRLPLLILQAGKDRIVDPEAPERWLAGTASRDATFVPLPDHLHEILNDLDWPQTVGQLLDWFEPRLATNRQRASRLA